MTYPVLRLIPIACALVLGGAFPVVAQTGGQSDPKAIAIADQVMEAMGGKENWDNTRYIRFSFFGSRLHYWDKWTGRYRVEWKNRDGDSYVVLMNLNTRKGQSYVNGEPEQGEALEESLYRAEGAWINDTYWFLMPYKLRDPGVILSYAGTETVDGVIYDKLHLRFENVGRTPGDQYWAYINPDTRLMDKWIFELERKNDQGQPIRGEWEWHNWQRYGRIMLSPERVNPEGQKRMMEAIAVFDTLPDAVFTSPEPVDIP